MDWPFSLIIEFVGGGQPSVRAWLPPARKRLLLRGPAAEQDWFPWWRRAWQHVTNNRQALIPNPALTEDRMFSLLFFSHTFNAMKSYRQFWVYLPTFLEKSI